MAEIETIYTGLKYSKTILKFYNEKKGTYEELISGKGFFSFAKPSPVAINFVLSFDNPNLSSTGVYGSKTEVESVDFLGTFGTNISSYRAFLDYPSSYEKPSYLYLYTKEDGGLYIKHSGNDIYNNIEQANVTYGIFTSAQNNDMGSTLSPTKNILWQSSSIGFFKRNDGFYGTYNCFNQKANTSKTIDYIEVWAKWYNRTTLFEQYILNYTVESYNPYEDGGDSDDGGGGGDFDNTSEDIEVPTLPTSSATASGFVNIFAPTLNQLNQLASYMWSSEFYDNIVKLWADPMNVILGLSIVPVNVPVDDIREVKCGNVSSGVSMYHASTQFVMLDCGTINVNEYWGAYLDYSPYTKIQLYLPYCGTHSLDIDDIMGRSINVTYHIDILSGSCVAFVKSSGKGLNSVLYEFSGNVSTQIPVTGENFSRLIQTAISSVASLGSTVATGGLSAPMAISTIGSLANNVANSKPEIERSGSMSGSTGLMGIQKPYLILTRPKQCIPKNVQKFKGFPSMKFQKLSDVKGFTIISEILLKNITASDEEIAEIKNLLKEGVIL